MQQIQEDRLSGIERGRDSGCRHIIVTGLTGSRIDPYNDVTFRGSITIPSPDMTVTLQSTAMGKVSYVVFYVYDVPKEEIVKLSTGLQILYVA